MSQQIESTNSHEEEEEEEEEEKEDEVKGKVQECSEQEMESDEEEFFNGDPVEYLINALPKDLNAETFKQLILKADYCHLFYNLGCNYFHSGVPLRLLEEFKNKQDDFIKDIAEEEKVN